MLVQERASVRARILTVKYDPYIGRSMRCALTIAGSDSVGGAGIEADIKAMASVGVHACAVVTAVTAQNTTAVERIYPMPEDMVQAQLEAVLKDVDVKAIKKSLSVLKGGERLLIFPEGTRVKKGKKSEPKSGAVLLAQRAGVPLVPVYITHNRKPFQPVKVVMGEAYKPAFPTRRPSNEELEQATAELMAKVYALGNA